MKSSLLALVLVAASLSAASAQDARGRQRQPPGTGTNTGRSGGTSGGDSRGGGDDRGGSRRDPPSTGGDWNRDRGSDTGSTARRRVPRPDTTPLDGGRRDPGTAPQRDENGGSLGHAVRRDSMPGRDHTGVIGGYDPRRWDEHERDRYYWHTWNGRRYCHWVDPYGVDWYYWYFDDGYYTMRYHDGYWWRYDGRFGRWVYLHDGWWYYHDGVRVYAYEEDRGSYDTVSEDFEMPKTEQRKLELTVNFGHFGLPDGGQGSVINENRQYLDFDGNMGGVAAGAELNVGINRYLEGGVGVGYQSAAVDTHYQDYVNANGHEITQNLSVRNIPVNAHVKLMPFGRDQAIQPYVGAGVQVNNWRYQESGQYIDFNSPNYDIYKETYKASGVAVGPIAMVGAKVAVNKQVSLGVEYRKQWANGKLPVEQGFAGDHVDLGGSQVTAGVTIRLK